MPKPSSAPATEEELAAAAIDWALGRLGDRGYALRCLAFVEDAYERANGIEVFGGSSATESAELYGLAAYDADAPPPAGSLVFFAAEGPIDGRLRDWWKPADEAEFTKRAQRLVEQFNQYSPVPGLNVNGQLTLGENIGDLGGLSIAHRAYVIEVGQIRMEGPATELAASDEVRKAYLGAH